MKTCPSCSASNETRPHISACVPTRSRVHQSIPVPTPCSPSPCFGAMPSFTADTAQDGQTPRAKQPRSMGPGMFSILSENFQHNEVFE